MSRTKPMQLGDPESVKRLIYHNYWKDGQKEEALMLFTGVYGGSKVDAEKIFQDMDEGQKEEK